MLRSLMFKVWKIQVSKGTLKHFLSLGRIRQDTHHFRANLDTPPAELDDSDWLPVQAGPCALKRFFDDWPCRRDGDRSASAASHSRRVVTDLIRGKWGFQEIITTDDLVMGPIDEHGVCKAAVEALNSGVDLLLIAYDGLQFYRIYHCALSAHTGKHR